MSAITASKAKAKRKRAPSVREEVTSIVPIHGWLGFSNVLHGGLANTRAAIGLAKGLSTLLSIQLAESEVHLRESSAGDMERYMHQSQRTDDLRTWAAIAAALHGQLHMAECKVSSCTHRIRQVHKGGAQ